MESTGISFRDVVTAIVGLFMALFSFIARGQMKRIDDLEQGKVNKSEHTLQYENILFRLKSQDDSAVKRDEKLDKILDRLNGHGH